MTFSSLHHPHTSQRLWLCLHACTDVDLTSLQGGVWWKHDLFWHREITKLTDIYSQRLANSGACRGCCFHHRQMPTVRHQTDTWSTAHAYLSPVTEYNTMVGCTYVRNWAGKQRPHVVGRRIVIDTMISPGCIIQRNNCGIDLRNINRVINFNTTCCFETNC